MLKSLLLLLFLCPINAYYIPLRSSFSSRVTKLKYEEATEFIPTCRQDAKDDLLHFIITTDAFREAAQLGFINVGKGRVDEVMNQIDRRINALKEYVNHEWIVSQLPNLEGEWVTIHTSLPARNSRTTLSALSFNTFPAKEPPIIISSISQLINKLPTGEIEEYQYDNVIDFHTHDVSRCRITVRGRATFQSNNYEKFSNPLRFNVMFFENEISLLTEQEQIRFKEIFGFDAKWSMKKQIDAPFKSWVDIVYLDESLRIMSGANGNIYVLVKRY